MRILLTGATGLLGTEIMASLSARHEMVGVDVHTLDVSDAGCTDAIVSVRPGLVIHAAAYTDVDGCEQDPELATRVNGLGTRHVADACRRLQVPIVYISTDYVFDGARSEPYTDADEPRPLTVYGRSKLEGEVFVRERVKDFHILRTAWLYGRGGRIFVRAIVDKARRGEPLQVVNDQVGSPTYARDLAGAIGRLVAGAPPGIYHVTNGGACSWYEFAREILWQIGLTDHSVTPITSEQFDRPASRPLYSVLSNDRWAALTGAPLRPWPDALADALVRDSLGGAPALCPGATGSR